MQKFVAVLTSLVALVACSKHDPILPGVRSAIFATDAPTILDQNISDLPDAPITHDMVACPYTQDATNTIKRGDRKIFSGFPVTNSVRSTQTPVCSGKYVYAGLTTGELIKIDTNTRQVAWVADIFRPSNMTGGASVVDIVAPIVVAGADVYAGGLGDAFCRINAASGTKKWCANIGTAYSFVMTAPAIFVVGTDNNLYALRNSDGAIYWRTKIEKQSNPAYDNKIITIGRQKIDAETGKIIR